MRGFLSTLILITSISLILLFPVSLLAQRVVERPNQDSSYKRPVVKRVELKGVKAFGQGEIKKLLYIQPNHWYNFLKKRYLSKSNIRIDETTIKRFYMRRGFLFTQVQSDITYPSADKAIVTFYVDESRQTFLKSAALEGGLEPINLKFGTQLATLKIGKPINAEDVSSNGFKLRDLYADNGYPYAIDSSRYEFYSDSTLAALTYGVAESTFTINDSTRIVTRGKTRPFVIHREVIAKQGRMYRQKDITNSEQRLYTTGLFKFVSMRRNDSTAVITNDTCRVGFNLGLDERKQYFTGLGVGMGTQQYYDLVLRTFGQWGIRNIAGTGRGVVVSVRPYFKVTDKNGSLAGLHISDLGKRLRFTIISAATEIDYVAPWIFKWRVPITAKLIYEPYTYNPIPVTPFRYDRISAEAVFSRQLDRFTITHLTAHTEYVRIRNISPQQAPFLREEGKNQIRRILQLYTERDTRDNILVPQKGSYSFGGAEYVGGPLGGDFSYYKMQFSWSRYKLFTGANVLATRIWLGWLNDMFKNGKSAQTDRFIVGGATTIRGYTNRDLGPIVDGEPFGGRYLMVANIELRRPLFWRFGGTVFVDGGNAYSHFSDITPLSIRFSTGMGFQFFTPIGPIRLDYAVRLKKQFDLGAGLFHFSILYAF
jgi:outer membrane protein insertion porin family